MVDHADYTGLIRQHGLDHIYSGVYTRSGIDHTDHTDHEWGEGSSGGPEGQGSPATFGSKPGGEINETSIVFGENYFYNFCTKCVSCEFDRLIG